MNHTVSHDFLNAHHPLAGLDTWPETGPIYGLADDDSEPRAVTFWERIGERFRRSPPSDGLDAAQARIWY